MTAESFFSLCSVIEDAALVRIEAVREALLVLEVVLGALAPLLGNQMIDDLVASLILHYD